METATTVAEEPSVDRIAQESNPKDTPSVCTKQLDTPNDSTTSVATQASELDIVDSSHPSNDKNRKKKDRHLAQALKSVLNSMSALNTPEEKLAALCIKYADLMEENTKLKTAYKQTEKRVSQAITERDVVRGEMNKAITTRSRLESLCRELQKQNKTIREESMQRIKDAEDKRLDMTNRFQNTLSEIATVMQQNSEKNNKLRDDNMDMSSRLKNVCEQYEVREQVNGAQVVKLAKQIELETQLCDAKLAKANMEMSVERESILNEKTQLLKDIRQYQLRIEEMQNTELDLRSQISLYNEKYEEFQNALARSNKVFAGFKGDMELMSKKIVKQEKESASWKMRYERCQQQVDELTVERTRMHSDLSVATRQLNTLQKLCRTLHSERQALLSKLENRAKIPEMPIDISEEIAERFTEVSMCAMAEWFARTDDPRSKPDQLKEALQIVIEKQFKLIKDDQQPHVIGEDMFPESPLSTQSHMSDEPAYDTGVSSSSSVNGDKVECVIENNAENKAVDEEEPSKAENKKAKETQSKRKAKKT